MIGKKLRSMLGPAATVETDDQGLPLVVPRAEDECALIMDAAAREHWRVRVEGRGNWIPRDAPADLALTTRQLVGVTDLNPADLVATVRTGTPWVELQTALVDQGAWVPLDPPGSARTVGSVVATATAGPLRAGFGTPRDQILGLSLVTGDGRVLHVGGTVVKNVAGFDLTKLITGSFGAFGVVTSVNFRLRVVPRADLTVVADGDRDTLLQCARGILDTAITPGAIELMSPKVSGTGRWALGVRLLGSDASVSAEEVAVSAAIAPATARPLGAPEARHFWHSPLSRATEEPITLRIGALQSSLDEALDLLAHHLDENCEDWVMVSVPAGAVRWSGTAPVDRLRLLRSAAAQCEMPLTIERAPWAVRSQIGHFGAYREGVARVVGELRQSFGSADTIVAPLDAAS